MRSLFLVIAPGAALAAGSAVATYGGERDDVRPDRVVLESGEALEGRVVRVRAEELVLRARSRERTLHLAEVESFEAAMIELPRSLERLALLDPRDMSAHLAEAATLEQRNLPLEANLLYWQVLAWNANDTVANESLGHRRRGTRWVSPLKGRWYTIDHLAKERSDWGSAWELATTHFDLRTNLGLEEALSAAWALERGYFAFYELFGQELDLYELTDPMQVWIHADTASYREPGGGRRGYFSADEQRLSIDASRGLDLRLLMHELTHQLLYECAVAIGGAGALPGWLDEGLAQFAETAVELSPRAAVVEPTRGNARLFATHALADDPYRLGRVLTLSSGDFGASSRTGLKYAQAYTLVHFCLCAGGGRYRAPFFEYVRGAFLGKGSSTHFKKTLDVPERELEDTWNAYAAAAMGRR